MGIRAAFALLIGVGLGTACLAVGAAGPSYAQQCLLAAPSSSGCDPRHLEIELNATVAPSRLPGGEMTPVALEMGGEIGTANGGHPSALREAQMDFAGLAIDPRGLPACGLRGLQRRGVAAARDFCREAIVGAGMSHVGFARTGARVAAPLTLFNGGTEDGITTLFIHSAVPVPEPVPVVSVMKISRFGKGKDQGLRTAWRLPPIIDGTGSLLDFRFRLKRYLSIAGARHGYIAARCGNRGITANASKLLFRNEAKTPGVAPMTVLKGVLVVPCTPSR